MKVQPITQERKSAAETSALTATIHSGYSASEIANAEAHIELTASLAAEIAGYQQTERIAALHATVAPRAAQLASGLAEFYAADAAREEATASYLEAHAQRESAIARQALGTEDPAEALALDQVVVIAGARLVARGRRLAAAKATARKALIAIRPPPLRLDAQKDTESLANCVAMNGPGASTGMRSVLDAGEIAQRQANASTPEDRLHWCLHEERECAAWDSRESEYTVEDLREAFELRWMLSNR